MRSTYWLRSTHQKLSIFINFGRRYHNLNFRLHFFSHFDTGNRTPTTKREKIKEWNSSKMWCAIKLNRSNDVVCVPIYWIKDFSYARAYNQGLKVNTKCILRILPTSRTLDAKQVTSIHLTAWPITLGKFFGFSVIYYNYSLHAFSNINNLSIQNQKMMAKNISAPEKWFD